MVCCRRVVRRFFTPNEGCSAVALFQAEISQRDAPECLAAALLTGRRAVWHYAIIGRLLADRELLALGTLEEHSSRSACWIDKQRDSLVRVCAHQHDCLHCRLSSSYSHAIYHIQSGVSGSQRTTVLIASVPFLAV